MSLPLQKIATSEALPWPEEIGPSATFRQARCASGEIAIIENGFRELWINIYWPDIDFVQRISGVLSEDMAVEMLQMIRAVLPECQVGLTRVRRDEADIKGAIETYERMRELFLAARASDSPGEELLRRLGLTGASVATRTLFGDPDVATGEAGQ